MVGSAAVIRHGELSCRRFQANTRTQPFAGPLLSLDLVIVLTWAKLAGFSDVMGKFGKFCLAPSASNRDLFFSQRKRGKRGKLGLLWQWIAETPLPVYEN